MRSTAPPHPTPPASNGDISGVDLSRQGRGQANPPLPAEGEAGPALCRGRVRGEADLHAHTIYSDGNFTPAALVAAARAAGLAAVAVTDHDNMAGVAPCRQAAVGTGLEIVAGVEISSLFDKMELHILGYFFDDAWQRAPLGVVLDQARAARGQRCERIVARLNQCGVALTVDDVRAVAGPAAVGRPHVAEALRRRGAVHSHEEAFSRFLRPGRPGYVERERITTADAIGLINAAGGRAVLAHPGLANLNERIRDIADWGLAGLEVAHPWHSPAQTERYVQLAAALGLVATGGSDSHGTAPDQTALGCCRVSVAVLDQLRTARRNA